MALQLRDDDESVGMNASKRLSLRENAPIYRGAGRADTTRRESAPAAQTGAPVEEMLYYPFGSRWQNSTGFGWDEKFAQFPQRNDDIQKYQASFREYDPGLGRWMSPDRLAGNVMNPQSLDRYVYALNNPLANIDPLGLSCIHTDDGTTADNGDGKGCSEMNNNPQQVNVSGDGSGSVDTSSLGLLASLGYAWGVSGGAHIYAGGGGGRIYTRLGQRSPSNHLGSVAPLVCLGTPLNLPPRLALRRRPRYLKLEPPCSRTTPPARPETRQVLIPSFLAGKLAGSIHPEPQLTLTLALYI